jgi:hypothetical protein
MGIQQMLLAGGFTPTTQQYTSAGTFTVTAPLGCVACYAELWGGTGGGGAGAGSGCTTTSGGGGCLGRLFGQQLYDPGRSNAEFDRRRGQRKHYAFERFSHDHGHDGRRRQPRRQRSPEWRGRNRYGR